MPELVPLGRSGLRVPRLGLGTFNFGNLPSGCDEATSLSIVSAYLDAGYNYIDTANIYGNGLAETYAGKALKGRRDGVVLATKAGGAYGPEAWQRGTSREALTRALDDSLRRLDTDYVDLYQMHIFDYETPLEETLSTLSDLVRAGKVRHIGVSNWTASQITDAVRLCEIHGWPPIVALQPQYNILLRDIEVEIVPVCLKFEIAVLPWSPLAGGLLAGIYKPDEEPPETSRLASFAGMRERVTPRMWELAALVEEEAERIGATPAALSLAWLLRKPGVVAPLIGPEGVEQLQANLAAIELDVPQETLDRIDAASAPAIGYPHSFAGAKPRPWR